MGKIATIAFASALAAADLGGAVATAAPACPGHPGALGTSRTLPISFDKYQRLGRMQYKQTLPLADHEVVITFDDGPLGRQSDRALDILNAQCVKVDYFIVGEMAHYFPGIVRREYASGDTIGTHSQDHPLRFDRISDQKVQWEIDQGIASVGAALGNPAELAPFFRIPGLGRSKMVERELAKRRLIVFSADVVADDWFHHITPDQIIRRAMRRLKRRGRGILLLHDIHPATVLALPGLLKALKENGFRVVHVVPAGPPAIVNRPNASPVLAAAPAAPASFVKPAAAAPAWPAAIKASAIADQVALPAPGTAAFNVNYPIAPGPGMADGKAGPAWPRSSTMAVPSSRPQLPAPGLADIGVSLQGQELVGPKLKWRHALARRGVAVPRRWRRVPVRARRWRRARAAAHWHAESDYRRRKRTASLFQSRRRAKRKSDAF